MQDSETDRVWRERISRQMKADAESVTRQVMTAYRDFCLSITITVVAMILAAITCAKARGANIREEVARERIDLIELNHFYDERGRLVFDQTIFYDWSESDQRYNVRAWRLVKNPAQLPQRNWEQGGYAALWQDGEQLRQVIAPDFRETWTQYDPELLEREYLPKERRRELRILRANKPNRAAWRTAGDSPRPPEPVESR